MFCDLVGSTELSERLDPEDLSEVIRLYREVCAEVVARYDQEIARYLGDGLLVYFGYPRAHEDDPVRGVRAGLDILAELPRLNAEVKQRVPALHDRSIEVRIGIHTGLVVAGDLGSGQAREEDAIVGETPNLAARLQGIAEPNTVVIGDATRRLVRGVFVLEDFGSHSLKGIAEPVSVYRVLRATGVQSRLELAGAAGLTPLVGREQEVALLLDRWEQANEGHGQVVLVSGEAGIGKSRVLHAFRQRLADERHTWLELRCSAYHQNSSFHSVIDLLGAGLLVAQGDSDEEKVARLERALSQSGLDTAATLPLFATLLSVPLSEPYAPPSGTPQDQRRQMLEALVSWMLSLCEHQPVVLVAEDLHWIDPSTLELLGMLLEQVPTAEILLVPTFRPSFESPWPARQHVVQLALPPFTRRQVRSMVDAIRGAATLPAAVVDELVARTDGVPLFVEELTKAVLESAAAHPGAHAIPETLQDSLMARLDRLGSAKEVAQLGAVLGREFSYELLRAVSGRDAAALQDDLERLEASELLFRRSAPPHASYVFKHTLVQDAAYQSLLKARRRELHGHTARVLEEHFPDVRDTHPELLAHHFAEAGLEAEAIDYYGLSGRRAHERSAYDEAAAHLERGLELLASLPATPERAERELAMQLALGLALQVSKGLGDPDVERAFLRARELCRQGGEVRELFPALWGLWLYNHQGHSYRTADRLAEQLLQLAETTRESDLLLQAHHAGWSTAQIRGSLEAAREHVLAGLAIYRPEAHHAQTHRFGNHDPGVCGLYSDAWVLALLGHPGQSTKRLEEALALAESLGHPFTRIICRMFGIFIALTLRDPPRVIAHIGELTAAAEALGGLPEEPTPFAVCLQGWRLLQGGRSAEGCARIREGVDAMLARGELLFLPVALAILCEASAAEGRPDEGLELLAKSRSQIDAMGGNYYEPELHRVRGELLHARADGGERAAEAAFREALEVARRQHARLLELRAAVGLARLLEMRDEKDDARALLTPFYDWFTEGFDTQDLKDAKKLLDELT